MKLENSLVCWGFFASTCWNLHSFSSLSHLVIWKKAQSVLGFFIFIHEIMLLHCSKLVAKLQGEAEGWLQSQGGCTHLLTVVPAFSGNYKMHISDDAWPPGKSCPQGTLPWPYAMEWVTEYTSSGYGFFQRLIACGIWMWFTPPRSPQGF